LDNPTGTSEHEQMSNDSGPDHEALRLEAWKQSISATMHFTDMSVKARQLGFAFAIGALALSVTLLARFKDARLMLPIGNHEYGCHISSVIMFCAAIALIATRYLDLKVYHRMLRGSVDFTQAMEKNGLAKDVFFTEFGLATSISKQSRSVKPGWLGRLRGKTSTTAERKIAAFYNISILAIVILSATLAFATWRKVEVYPTIYQRLDQSVNK
jgi:hypothetical protein